MTTVVLTAPTLPTPYTTQPAPVQLVAPPSAQGTVYDLSNQLFHMFYSANPNTDNGSCAFTGPGALPVQRDPIVNPGDVTPGVGSVDGVFYRGKIQGNISLVVRGDVSASNGGYCNSAAVNHRRSGSTQCGVERMRIDRVWDAVRWPQEPGRTSGGCNHRVEDCWFSNVRDDAIEYDLGYSGMTVRNTLVDRCFSFMSYAPGGTPNDHSTDTIWLEDNLIRMNGFPYGELQSDGVTRIVKPYHIGFFKTQTTAIRLKMPRIAMYRNVIAAEVYIPNNTSNIATGTAWADSFRQIDPARCQDNIFLWLPDTPLPSLMIAEMPANGFTVITGADARFYWEYRKAEWIHNHREVTVPPGLSGMPGFPKYVERLPTD